MRSLIFVCLWFLTSAAYAASCGTYLKRTDSSGVATVDCSSCNKMNDFASYGAAMLHASGQYKRAYVTKGATEVEVILRNSYRDTRLSWGIWGFSWTFKATNYAERLVDAFPRRGSVSGSPWNRQPVSTSSLRAKCKEIEKEKAKKRAERDELTQAMIDDVAAYISGEGGPGLKGFSAATSLSSILIGLLPRWDFCTACTSENIN